jgi:hypothetical protein
MSNFVSIRTINPSNLGEEFESIFNKTQICSIIDNSDVNIRIIRCSDSAQTIGTNVSLQDLTTLLNQV